MTLLDHFLADLNGTEKAKHKETILSYWRRALEETVWERSLTQFEYAHNRNTKRQVVRWLPFWLAVPDEELDECLEAVKIAQRIIGNNRAV